MEKPMKIAENGVSWTALRGASPRLEFGRHLLAILHSFLRLGVIFTAPWAPFRATERPRTGDVR